MRSAGEEGKETLGDEKAADRAGDLGTILSASIDSTGCGFCSTFRASFSGSIFCVISLSQVSCVLTFFDLTSSVSSFDDFVPDSFRCNFSAVFLINEETLLLEMVKVTFDVTVVVMGGGVCFEFEGMSLEEDITVLTDVVDGEVFLSDVLLVITATRHGSEGLETEVLAVVVIGLIILFSASSLIRSTGGFGGGPLGLRGGSGGGPPFCCC